MKKRLTFQNIRPKGIKVLLAAVSLCSSMAAWAQNTTTYTASGTFVVPSGVTSITVECWGGGGGGGGTAVNPSRGGGGGGGSYAKSVISTTGGTSYVVTVGAGGLAGTNSGGNGGQGGASSLAALVIAPGGNGGNGGISGTPNGIAGTGATGATGDVVFNGGNGTDATGTYSGAGGGGAGTAASGNNATTSTGGVAVTGGGAGAAGRTTSAAGLAGSTPGGGGSGGFRASTTVRAGGAGGAGKVSITYTCPAIVSLPYTVAIDAALVPSLPTCTSLENVNADAYTWRTYVSTSTPGFAGPVIAYPYSSTSAANDWFFTRGVTLNAGTSYRLSFLYNNDGSIPSDAPDYYPEKLKVMYGTSPAAAAMLLPIANYPTVAAASAQTAAVDFTPSTTGVYYLGFQAYSDADMDILQLSNISLDVTPACPSPTSITVDPAINTASVSWTSPGSSFIIEYGPTGFTPGTGATAGGGTVVTATASPATISSLSPNTTYQIYVRLDCTGSSNGYSNNSIVASFTTDIANDDAPGATQLTLGAGCTGAPYSNIGATQGASEPVSNCNSTTSYATVWFQFTAPASGSVKISTDLGTGGTLTDTRVGLFSATNVNDYGTFSLIGCDEDGGYAINSGFMSVLYASGLTSGTTYYIAVGMYDGTVTQGTFCLAVDELSSAMLATTNTCSSSYQVPQGSNSAYTGWVPLLDASSRLVALVRKAAGGSVGGYTVAQNINTGAVRQDAAGLKYLDRNFRITNAGAGPYEVRLFLLTTEQAALQVADPNATLANLNITRQTGESACTNNFAAGGTNSLITQTSSGSGNGVSWVQFTTPGFSNFFINAGNNPLPVTLESFTGKNSGVVNHLSWKTTAEKNFSHFELQRSADGIRFDKVTSINANKVATGSSYTYTDEHPLQGINIYRLNMVDIDGRAALSDVVKLVVASGDGLSVNVYPNPVTQQLQVNVAGKIGDKAQIQLININGQVLQMIPVSGQQTPVDMNGYAAGTYMIRYTDSNHNTVIRISKN